MLYENRLERTLGVPVFDVIIILRYIALLGICVDHVVVDTMLCRGLAMLCQGLASVITEVVVIVCIVFLVGCIIVVVARSL